MKPLSEYLTREARLSRLRDKQWQIERDRRRTREERRMRRISLTLDALLLLFFLALMCVVAFSNKALAESGEPVPVGTETTVSPVEVLKERKLEAALAVADVNKEAEEPTSYTEWFRANATRVEDCKLTHYCAELYPHICGTGDGITSTGVPVTAYWSCAVDPTVIPYGAAIMVDYGDGVEFRKAQDRGPGVKGNHLDLAVASHAEANSLGIKNATVYWLMEETA